MSNSVSSLQSQNSHSDTGLQTRLRIAHVVLLRGFESLIKGRSTFRYLSDLERTQWLSRAELEQRQVQSLRQVLRHAFEKCDYYQEQWREHGLNPAAVEATKDLQRWPVLDRKVITSDRMRMRARGQRAPLISKATGGSSGEPLRFDLNCDSNDRRVAAAYRGYGWAGGGPGTKQLYLWGSVLGPQSTVRRWKDRLYHQLHRRKMLNCFELTEAAVPAFLAVHNRYRPDVVVAYTNPIYEFARMLEERGVKPFSPTSIIVGAEKLYPFQRELIERVFDAPVFETYGSREFMLTGCECDRHEGLHLTMEHLLVEILNDDGTLTRDGDEGNVVITDLYNYGMPFIRYLTGDRAVAGWTMCSCGRGLPLLQRVVGRQLDILHTPDGRRVPGEIFPYLLKDFANVKRFQVVQDRPDHVELRVVTRDGWSESDGMSIERVLRTAFGPSMRFDMVQVDEIPLTGAGKLRVVVNLCQKSDARQRSSANAPAEFAA